MHQRNCTESFGTLLATLAVAGSLCLGGGTAAAQAPQSSGTSSQSQMGKPVAPTVATVYGTPIQLAEITPTPEAVRRRLQNDRARGKAPEGPEPEEQERLAIEKERLASKITALVRAHLIRQYNIQVSDYEVSAAQKAYDGADPRGSAATFKNRLQLLAKALSEVYEHGQNRDVTYKRLLAGSFTQEEWSSSLLVYKERSARDRLQRTITSINADSMRVRPEAVRNVLLQSKLDKILDEDVKRQESEYERALDKVTKNDQNPPPFNPRDAYAAWWRKRYQEANIHILDPRFAEVYTQKIAATTP